MLTIFLACVRETLGSIPIRGREKEESGKERVKHTETQEHRQRHTEKDRDNRMLGLVALKKHEEGKFNV